MQLADKVALITGGGEGIGKYIDPEVAEAVAAVREALRKGGVGN